MLRYYRENRMTLSEIVKTYEQYGSFPTLWLKEDYQRYVTMLTGD